MIVVDTIHNGMQGMLEEGQERSGIVLSTWVEHWVTQALVRTLEPSRVAQSFFRLNVRYSKALTQEPGSNQAYALREVGDEALVLAGLLVAQTRGERYQMAAMAGPNAYASCARLNSDWEVAEEVADAFHRVVLVLHAARGIPVAPRVV